MDRDGDIHSEMDRGYSVSTLKVDGNVGVHSEMDRDGSIHR